MTNASAVDRRGFLAASAALADTTDVTWQNRLVVAKEGTHCVDDPNCFNRYHSQIPPVARARPGDHIVFETRDALDSDLTLDSTADDVTALDLNLVHPMTGPVHIEGAEVGDVLELPDQEATLLLAERWAIPDRRFVNLAAPVERRRGQRRRFDRE